MIFDDLSQVRWVSGITRIQDELASMFYVPRRYGGNTEKPRSENPNIPESIREAIKKYSTNER